MRFIDNLFQALEQAINDLPKELNRMLDESAPKNWCIGSGSSFVVYENIVYSKAKEIFDNLDVRQCCGRLIEEKEVGTTCVQTYSTMESISGRTSLFIFPIERVVKES